MILPALYVATSSSMRDWMGGLPNTDLHASVNACCRVRLFASAYSLMFIALSFHQELDWGFRGLFPSVPTIPSQALDSVGIISDEMERCLSTKTYKRVCCSSLFRAISQYSGEISMPTAFRLSCLAATKVVPEPRNGSRIVSPSFVLRSISLLITDNGF